MTLKSLERLDRWRSCRRLGRRSLHWGRQREIRTAYGKGLPMAAIAVERTGKLGEAEPPRHRALYRPKRAL